MNESTNDCLTRQNAHAGSTDTHPIKVRWAESDRDNTEKQDVVKGTTKILQCSKGLLRYQTGRVKLKRTEQRVICVSYGSETHRAMIVLSSWYNVQVFTCLYFVVGPKPSFGSSWGVGDAVVGRGHAGWTTSQWTSMHPCRNC